VTAFPLQLLPRRCPLCGDETIIGHGQRRKQAHDQFHDWIWVRRGICHPCSKTFTILLDWLVPSAHFSLRCRQQACEHLSAGSSVDQAAPHCKDPSRSPRSLHSPPVGPPSPAQRVLLGEGRSRRRHFLRAPTILAWDLSAVCRILPIEARSP
jgi:transposase-like protein